MLGTVFLAFHGLGAMMTDLNWVGSEDMSGC